MVTIILTCLGLLGIALVIRAVFFDYSASAIAIARHDLFLQRDRLFQLADEGKAGFDNRTYVAVRAMINGYIQYAHRLTFSQMVLTKIVMILKRRPSRGIDWNREIDNLPADEREAVREVLHDAIITMLRLMITRSPLLSTAFFVFVISRVTSTTCSKVVERVRKAKDATVRPSEAAYEDVLAHKPGREFAFVVSYEARRVNQSQFPFVLQAA